MIERLRVRIPAGEFSSPELTLCADSYSVDYGNTKAPSMLGRLGSAILSQLAVPGESKPKFPMGEIPMGQ